MPGRALTPYIRGSCLSQLNTNLNNSKINANYNDAEKMSSVRVCAASTSAMATLMAAGSTANANTNATVLMLAPPVSSGFLAPPPTLTGYFCAIVSMVNRFSPSSYMQTAAFSQGAMRLFAFFSVSVLSYRHTQSMYSAHHSVWKILVETSIAF